jgi:two-component system nitrogen regulation response regulator GlnG
MSDDPLVISTLATQAPGRERVKVAVPCATIACHPDPRRIGERALLTGLLVRQRALISRSEMLFAHAGDERRRPLADPYLSRDPLRLLPGPTDGSLILENLPERAQIDGNAAGGTCQLPTTALQDGVLLQLSSRVLLLLHGTAAQPPLAIDGILGHSDAVDRLRRQVARLAELEAAVLVRGESGTGKELVAHALHTLSRRRAEPFVAVNMSTLSEATAVGTLFGYARGAFTGAQARHHGLFERANHGTLFLDEIGDTPQSVQPMLLRVLENGRILPLGDERERSVDVRVIAATELDLEAGTPTGSFRQALKHRLAGYEVAVPALRERPDDIPRLFVHFLRLELEALGCEGLLDCDESSPSPALRSQLIAQLMRRAFRGNVRELINLARKVALDALDSGELEFDATAAIEASPPQARPERSAAARASADPVATDCLESGNANTPSAAEAVAAYEESLLRKALHDAQGNRGRAAAQLGMPLRTFMRKLSKLGLIGPRRGH